MIQAEKNLYRQCIKLGVDRECALNLILVKSGFKNAATVGYSKRLLELLKKNKYNYIIDTSYVTRSIHGFLEETTKTRVPGAAVNRRIYVGHGINKEKLKYLTTASNFGQGLLFGFPLCCTLSFCAKAAHENKRFIGVLKDWVGSLPPTGGKKHVDYRLIGSILKYLQPIRLSQHIPCKPDCRESLALAERNLCVLEMIDPEFKHSAVSAFGKPVLLYGNTWENVGMIQLEGLKQLGPGRYAARCHASVLPEVPANAGIEITLKPGRGVIVETAGKVVVNASSARALPWSYCIIVPVDTLSASKVPA